MKRQPRILAGTALGLLMASAPLSAFALGRADVSTAPSRVPAPFILAQAECPEGTENCAPSEEQPPKKRQHEQQQQEQAPAEQAAPSEEQQPPKKRQHEQQQEQAPAEQAAPSEEQQPPKKRQQQQQEQAPAEQAVPSEEQQPPKKRQQQQEQAPAEQAAPSEEQPPPKKRQQQQEQAPAEQAAPEQKAPSEAPLPTQKPPQQGETAPEPGQLPATEEQPVPQPKPAEQPSGEQKPSGTERQPAPEAQPPAQGEQPVQGEAPVNPDEAPILDSQKDQLRRDQGKQGQNGQQGGRQQGGQAGGQQAGGQQPPPPVDQGPPPTDDKSAQQEIKPEKIVPVTEEQGKRVERAPSQDDVMRRPRPQGADVLKEIGDRIIIQFNNQTFVESNDRPRLSRGAQDVYYEDLPYGRTRETIVRDNGNRIVTIRNRNGDIIQRSRITPDGREYILSYVDERHYEDVRDWRDPGLDLPPMRLNIPRRQYILDAESARGPDDYYRFLEQPPVERVQRLYSIDEVKRSARVRDIARRVDMDTLNFDFGSASISDSEIQKLQGVADAMERLLQKNPGETFLIEGHTDAVGSETANLALSDRRAESVANALSNVFDIPPENLVTQGYGEEYLKISTQAPERENRRVAIRRITPLVAPVASAN